MPRFTMLLLWGLLGAASLGHAQTPRDAPQAIAAATAAGDANALAALYAPNAVLLTPQGQTIMGRDAIRAVFAANHALGPNRLRIADVELDGDENRAMLLMGWHLRIEPANRAPIEVRGRSMLYFMRTADGWRIAADMFQNLPPAR